MVCIKNFDINRMIACVRLLRDKSDKNKEKGIDGMQLIKWLLL